MPAEKCVLLEGVLRLQLSYRFDDNTTQGRHRSYWMRSICGRNQRWCCRNAATLKRCALPRGARASRMAGVQNSARRRPLHPVHPQCSSHSAAHFQAISVAKAATSTCFEYIRVYGSTLEVFHVASTVIIVSSYRSSLPQETSDSTSLSNVSGGWIISSQPINISEFSTIDNQNCKVMPFDRMDSAISNNSHCINQRKDTQAFGFKL